MKAATARNQILSQKDYLLVSLIGISFAIFSVPIIKNLLTTVEMNTALVLALILCFLLLSNIALWIASVIAKSIPVVLQIAKFAAVGAFNTFLSWAIINILISITLITKGVGYSVFFTIAFIVANIASFFWNKYWTFTSSEDNKTDYMQFITVSLFSLGAAVLASAFVVNIIGAPEGFTETEWANVGNVCGTAISMVSNFLGYKFWVFKK